MAVYDQPLYYEIAFGFVDPKKQVDLFERYIAKYSKIPAKRFLDIGCGPALQLREIARRGYDAVAVDRSPRMLAYVRARAGEEGTRIETVRANMIDFRLSRKVDFASIMMGTIAYVSSNEEYLRHLDSVARALKPGGLYLIENSMLDWASRSWRRQTWTMRRGEIRVKTTFSLQLDDTLHQIARETVKLEVNDHGRKLTFENVARVKMIFPQEMLTLIELNGRFEFLGWFERFRLRELKKPDMDNITLLRRKQA